MNTGLASSRRRAPSGSGYGRFREPSRAAYLNQYKTDTEAAIKAGFVLANDRAGVLAFADPSRIAG